MNSLPHISFSAINSFTECPRGWFIRYVLKEKEVQTEAARFGSQFDQSVAVRLGILNSSEIRGPVAEGIPEAVTAYMNSGVEPLLKGAKEAQKKIEITPEQWATYAEIHGVASEIFWNLIGFVDLIGTDETGLRKWVLDLKTSDRKGFRCSWAVQVLLYALAEGAADAFDHLLTKTKVPAVYRYTVPVNTQTLGWAMMTVGYYAAAMREALKLKFAEDLPARPDYWCSWCPGNLRCVGAQMQMIRESA